MEAMRQYHTAICLLRHLDAMEGTFVTALRALKRETERVRSVAGHEWITGAQLNCK
jgi:hypothetical protein